MLGGAGGHGRVRTGHEGGLGGQAGQGCSGGGGGGGSGSRPGGKGAGGGGGGDALWLFDASGPKESQRRVIQQPMLMMRRAAAAAREEMRPWRETAHLQQQHPTPQPASTMDANSMDMAVNRKARASDWLYATCSELRLQLTMQTSAKASR
jgi:hypothetical protein